MTKKSDIPINPDMTILDVVSTHQETISVFKSFDEQAGECICCTSLFMTIRDVAAKYNIDLPGFLSTLEKAILNHDARTSGPVHFSPAS